MMRDLPYAPTPYSYTPNTTLSSRINPDKEVKLSETAAERELHDSLAEIYSIIVTLDGLEKAYIKDSVPEAEYTELCNRLLKQYKGNLSDETVSKAFVDLETFKKEWNLECPRATERLRIDLPSTVSEPSHILHHHQSGTPSTNSASNRPPNNPHASNPSGTTPLASSTSFTSQNINSGVIGSGGHNLPPLPHQQQQHQQTSSTQIPSNSQVLLATESFITLLDALRLGYASKDQLHPLLAELIQAVNAVTDRDFEGRAKIIAWLIRLNGLKAQEELDKEVEVREMAFEMEVAYRGFKGTLN